MCSWEEERIIRVEGAKGGKSSWLRSKYLMDMYKNVTMKLILMNNSYVVIETKIKEK